MFFGFDPEENDLLPPFVAAKRFEEPEPREDLELERFEGPEPLEAEEPEPREDLELGRLEGLELERPEPDELGELTFTAVNPCLGIVVGRLFVIDHPKYLIDLFLGPILEITHRIIPHAHFAFTLSNQLATFRELLRSCVSAAFFNYKLLININNYNTELTEQVVFW